MVYPVCGVVPLSRLACCGHCWCSVFACWHACDRTFGGCFCCVLAWLQGCVVEVMVGMVVVVMFLGVVEVLVVAVVAVVMGVLGLVLVDVVFLYMS